MQRRVVLVGGDDASLPHNQPRSALLHVYASTAKCSGAARVHCCQLTRSHSYLPNMGPVFLCYQHSLTVLQKYLKAMFLGQRFLDPCAQFFSHPLDSAVQKTLIMPLTNIEALKRYESQATKIKFRILIHFILHIIPRSFFLVLLYCFKVG